MSAVNEKLEIATQGGEWSYHAIAARNAAGDIPVVIDPHERFRGVVRASRRRSPGLGVIAMTSVVGTIEDSAESIMAQRPSALPPIVGREDIEVELGLIGISDPKVEDKVIDISRMKIHLVGQKPAVLQSSGFIKSRMPWVKTEYRHESTAAIQEVIEKNDPDWYAIGPREAAEPMHGLLVHAPVNPEGSVTSFFVLQRDPRQSIFPEKPERTQLRTVLSLVHPHGDGELDRCWELAADHDLRFGRFIPFQDGGLIEILGDLYDEQVTEYCSLVNGLKPRSKTDVKFDAHVLGGYSWYPEPTIDPLSLLEKS